MSQPAAFVGLTGFLLSVLLALTWLSSRVLDEHTESHPVAAPADPPQDPTIPRFETATAARQRRRGERDETLTTGGLLANVALTQGLFGVVILASAVYFGVPLSSLGVASTPLSTGTAAVAIGVGAGVGFWIGNEFAAVVVDGFGVAYDESLRELLAPESTGGWVVLLVVVLPTIAIVEELLFRGAAIGVPVAELGVPAWAMVIVSSVAFALGHSTQGRVGILVTGGLGLALAALFVVTNSLLAVVVAHYLVNALELIVHEGLGVDRLSSLI